MGDDELYIGPTALGPGVKEPGQAGERLARKILIPLAVVLGVVVIVFYVLFDFGRVSGPSMVPTLRDSDHVLMTKGVRYPRRGDIVFTSVMEGGKPVELIKRVIAVPGDLIAISNDSAIVNGVPEPQRGQFVLPAYSSSFPTLTVPPGTVYLMGDNRPVSYDSRYIGPEPISGIKGRIFAVYSPITRIRFVH
jgi:signal peptidase I